MQSRFPFTKTSAYNQSKRDVFKLMSLFFPSCSTRSAPRHSWLFPGKHGYFPVLGKSTTSTHPVHPGAGDPRTVTSGTVAPAIPHHSDMALLACGFSVRL